MKRLLKTTGFVIVSIIVVLVLFLFYRYKDVFLIEKHTPKEHASLLKPHFQIKRPPGDGSFPAVICYHGSDGLFNPDKDKWRSYDIWADYFVSLGYASIFVDSYTGRGYTSDDINNKVLTGRKLWGYERAGDVLIAIDEVRKLPFVNPNQLALIGWSHGGWAIMSLFSYNLVEKLPWNLRSSSPQPLSGVKGAVTLSPYFPTWLVNLSGEKWNESIKTLVLMGGKDPFTKYSLKSILILIEKNRPISYHVYPSAGHHLELNPEDEKYYPAGMVKIKPAPNIVVDSRARIKEFLSEAFK